MQVRFSTQNPDFFIALRKEVDAYFKDNKLSMNGGNRLLSKAILLLTALAVWYIWLVFFTPDTIGGILALSTLLGLNFAAIGFNVMHDGAHGSFSKKSWLNELMGYSLNLMGGNLYLWKQKHNINHHSFTNIEGIDDDIDIKPWIRVNEQQSKYWFHRFQHVYWFVLYSLSYLLWVFVQDFKKYFSGKIGETKYKKMNRKEHVIFWFSKLLYLTVFIVIPITKLGFEKGLLIYLTSSAVTGWVIAVIFQLAHVVEGSDFPEVSKVNGTVENNWAVHQLSTTFNFATKNKLVNWFTGGLNFQVEHHLFPKISHIHYPKINHILKETCKQHGVVYNEFPTMIKAIKSHVLHLKQVAVM